MGIVGAATDVLGAGMGRLAAIGPLTIEQTRARGWRRLASTRGGRDAGAPVCAPGLNDTDFAITTDLGSAPNVADQVSRHSTIGPQQRAVVSRLSTTGQGKHEYGHHEQGQHGRPANCPTPSTVVHRYHVASCGKWKCNGCAAIKAPRKRPRSAHGDADPNGALRHCACKWHAPGFGRVRVPTIRTPPSARIVEPSPFRAPRSHASAREWIVGRHPTQRPPTRARARSPRGAADGSAYAFDKAMSEMVSLIRFGNVGASRLLASWDGRAKRWELGAGSWRHTWLR